MRGTYSVDIGSQHVELPIVSLNDTLALALLITVDMGVAFMERAGAELAEVLAPYDVDVVATVATMGIPLAVEVTRHLGLDQYVVLAQDAEDPSGRRHQRAGALDHDGRRAAPSL